jgi:putative heme iron utilization protein
MTDPYRPLDDEARTTARQLLQEARHGALAVLAAPGQPMVTRVACLWDGPAMLILVSTLSAHTAALDARPESSLLLGDPGPRGDPLVHPRLTLMTRAQPDDKAARRAQWLAAHPKAALYYDFTDFRLLRLVVGAAFLNGGFGKAYRLGPDDITALQD